MEQVADSLHFSFSCFVLLFLFFSFPPFLSSPYFLTGYAVQVVKENLFQMLAAGRKHTCGILQNGTSLCWGRDTLHGWVDPSSPGTFDMLSSFGDMTCGIRMSDKQIECFGVVPPQIVALSTTKGILGGTRKYRSVASGGRHVCALVQDHAHDIPGRRGSGSSLVCWGSNERGQSEPPSHDSVTYLKVTVGLTHSCAITEKFALLCWGAKEPVESAMMSGLGESVDEDRVAGINVNTFL